MATITVFVGQDDADRKRRTKRGVVVALACILTFAAAFGDRKPSDPAPPLSSIAPSPSPSERIVYVDRTRLQYPEPVGPSRPRIAETPPIVVVKDPIVVKVPGTRIEPTPVVPESPEEHADAIPVTIPPRSPRRLIVEPPSIRFRHGGTTRVVVSNPNLVPITILRISLDGPTAGFRLQQHSRCVQELSPGERCSFSVLATPVAHGEVWLKIDHDG